MKTEKEEAEEEPFVIRPYLKSELAHKYNPHLPLIYAMQKLRGWIRNNKELYDAMYSGGEGRWLAWTAPQTGSIFHGRWWNRIS